MDSGSLNLDEPAGVLAALVADRALADAAEVRILERAADWVDQHPALDPVDEAWPSAPPTLEAADTGERSFGVPAPRWTEVAEPAAALGLRTRQGQDLMLEAMVLRHLLPRVWAAMRAGRVSAWRARRIARVVAGHPADVAAYVDDHVAQVAGSIGVAGLDKLLDEAMLRLYPAERERDLRARLDARFVKLFDKITHTGVAEIQIRADLADALDLEAAVATIATALGAEGDPDTWDVRRSKAIGILADPQLAAYYLATPAPGSGRPIPVPVEEEIEEEAAARDPEGAQAEPAPASADAGEPGVDWDEQPGVHADEWFGARARPGRRQREREQRAGQRRPPPALDDSPGSPLVKPRLRPHREVVMHVHLSEGALRGYDTVGRLERGDQPIDVELIRAWCARPDTKITVQPVRDLAEHIHVNQYEATDRLKDQCEQVNQTCVFPWCARPARACDKDHNVAHGDGGATCSCNIGPLCRRHHRTKQHTAWTYTPLDTGAYLWRSPHGRHYLRDDHGTHDVTPVAPPDRSPPDTGCRHQAGAAQATCSDRLDKPIQNPSMVWAPGASECVAAPSVMNSGV